MKKLSKTRQIAPLAILLAVQSSAFADETAEYIETMVVTAEREPGNLVLTSDDFARTQAMSLEDMFANQSTIAVGGGVPVAQKVYVRGFEDVMLNVTVDGAQAPGELYHHQGRIQLEPEFIKVVELDAGAGAATNGAGALTGAMRATLKDAFDLLEPNQQVGGFLKGTGRFNGDNGQEFTGSAYGRITDNIGVVAAYTFIDREDYEDGNGDTPGPSEFERNRGFVKLNGTNDAHSYAFTYEYLDDEAETFERPNLINFTGTYEVSDQEMSRETYAFNYDYAPDSDVVDVGLTIYYNTNDFTVQRQNAIIIYGDGDFDSIGFDLRNTSVFGNHKLTYGIDYREDEVDSAQNATPPFAWGDTEQEASVTGAYLQDNWSITDTVNLSFGARYDDYDFDGNNGVSDGVDISDSSVSGNVSLSWEVAEGLRLRAAYAEAFRGVTIREAFFSALYVHDGTLEPEEADNTELGFSWERDGYFVRGTWYQQDIENFIDAEFAGPFPVWGYWRNVGDAEVDGYEFEAGYQNDRFSLSLGVWDAENELNGEPLADGNLGLGTNIGRTWLGNFDYTFHQVEASLGMNLRYVEEEDNDIDPAAPDKDAYFLANIYANWYPTDAMTVSLKVTNLFDEFYFDHATYTWIGRGFNTYAGYPSMGREIVGSVSYRF